MAAGLGFKTFTTGEVLTAADVNGYLMQGILVFANAAARDAAITSPQEGQCCYLKDTDAVLTYSGSAWVGFDDSNAIQNSIINAKGDLISGSANDTPAILSVGSNGETLVADSSATTGLRWQGNFAAGKNKIINGDFNINQRAFTSTTTTGTYTFDRWLAAISLTAGTATFSAQTFTAGTAPVAGYESTNFLQCVTSGTTSSNTSTQVQFNQRMEDVRTFAGQTVTFSFWAKANSGTPNVAVRLEQAFGSGGSSQVFALFDSVKTITTSWARYTFTGTVPSISGKTIGTNSYLAFRIYVGAGSAIADVSGVGLQDNTFQFWGIQAETGNTATAFQTATGTLAGELAACQRYYYKHPTGANNPLTNCAAYSATNALGIIPFRVTMRTAPTMSVVTGTNYYQIVANGGVDNINSFTQDSANTDSATIYNNTEVAQTAGHAGIFISNNASASIAWSAEL